MKKRVLLMVTLIFGAYMLVNAWGFWAHQRINRIAVFTLPPEMIGFYKTNIEYITAHAVDPDKRRYAFDEEAPRHYIDLDHYGKYPYDTIPRKWNDAVAKFSEDTLMAYGIVPWHVEVMYYRLVDAFKAKDANRILKISADIGHYIGDAHVPLHTTENYNGQQTDQVGIHGLLESRLPEVFGNNYDFFVGKADYVDKPLDFMWKTVLQSNKALDSVFAFEKQASINVGSDLKYAIEQKGAQSIRVYSQEFSAEYSRLLSGLVERRMRQAIIAVGSLWYTAWVDAGQPEINNLTLKEPNEEDKKEAEFLNNMFNAAKRKGRIEAD
jgi:hypothetical protein